MAATAVDSRVALLEHARASAEAARATVAHSLALKTVFDEWQAGILTKRCAWCSRYRLGDTWVELRAIPNADRVTHSICDDCTEALRGAGLSK